MLSSMCDYGRVHPAPPYRETDPSNEAIHHIHKNIVMRRCTKRRRAEKVPNEVPANVEVPVANTYDDLSIRHKFWSEQSLRTAQKILSCLLWFLTPVLFFDLECDFWFCFVLLDVSGAEDSSWEINVDVDPIEQQLRAEGFRKAWCWKTEYISLIPLKDDVPLRACLAGEYVE